MKADRRLVVATGLLLCLAGCPQKVPYPTRQSPSQAQPPRDLSEKAVEKTPSPAAHKDAATPEPVSWHGALLWTPEGTIRVKAGPGGKDLSARLMAGQWIRVADNEVRVVRVQAETRKAHPKGKDSRLVKVLWQRGSVQQEMAIDRWSERPDLAEAARADPDLAAEFYHREQLTAIGAQGSRLVFLLSVDGYLGGAHPYAVRRLLVLDVDQGTWVPDPDPTEAVARARATLGDAWQTACLRRPAGIAEMTGPGGREHRVLGLAHDVESCAGRFRLLEVGRQEAPEGGIGPDRTGRWTLREGLSVGPVVDWRQDRDRRWTVLLNGRDPQDRLAPVEKAWQPDTPREVSWWEPGLDHPLPVGRAPRLLEVQFLEALPGEWSRTPATPGVGQKGSGGGGIGVGS